MNIITLKNETSYFGKTNKIPAKTKGINLSCDGSQPVVFSIIKDATFSAPLTYTTTSVDSTVTYGANSSVITGGSILSSFALSKTDSIYISEKEFETFLSPGETVTISAKVASGTSAVVATINCLEDH